MNRAVVGAVLVVVVGCGGAPKSAERPAPASSRLEPIAKRIDDHVAAGRRLWQESCPVPGVAGLCATLALGASLPACAGTPTPRLEVVARDSGLAMQAMGELSRAVELWDNGTALDHDQGKTPAEKARIDRAMIDQVAAAYFTLGEPVLESLLARAPSYLGDGAGAEAAGAEAATPTARLRDWVSEVGRATKELERHYLRLGDELQVDVADPWVAAAAARMALVHRYHADTLIRAAIAADAGAEVTQTGCTTLAPLLGPLRDKAAALLTRCQALGPAAVAGTPTSCAELAGVTDHSGVGRGSTIR